MLVIEDTGEESDNEGTNDMSDDNEKLLAKLIRISMIKGKREMVNEFMCGGSVGKAAQECTLGACDNCGLKLLWSNGLRKELVDGGGKLLPGVDQVLLTTIKWECMRNASKQGIISATSNSLQLEKELLRQKCEGTVLDLLDDFEFNVMNKYPFYRKTLIRQKEADQQR